MDRQQEDPAAMMRVDRLEGLYALAEEDRQQEVPECPSDWSRRSLAVADPAGRVASVIEAGAPQAGRGECSFAPVERKEVTAGPGDVVVMEPETPHRFWNAGETEAVFLCEVAPALQFESLIETTFALAQE